MMPFYAQVLAVLAIPVVLIHVVGLLGPPLYDLIRRDDDEVGPWWGAPVALTVFDTLVGTWFFVQTALTPGEEHAMGTRMGIATGLLALAGVLVGMVMALSFVRGITPGGETTRRFRTSVAAGLGMLGITVLLPLCLAKWNALGPLVWLLPAAWGGLAWVSGLNRRGPARIENARRVAVGWLVLAGNAALLSLVAMLIFAYWDDTANGVHHIRHVTGRSQRALALVLCAWGALMAGFRMVSGPWPRWIWPATAALVPPLFAGHLVWALFSPVPRFLELPAPLDVSG
ncbi:MAG: hypothetical protein KC656_29885, partial [Myxococcales bacterium]|nr:hypothetical protein [Myxococcales bacterium]